MNLRKRKVINYSETPNDEIQVPDCLKSPKKHGCSTILSQQQKQKIESYTAIFNQIMKKIKKRSYPRLSSDEEEEQDQEISSNILKNDQCQLRARNVQKKEQNFIKQRQVSQINSRKQTMEVQENQMQTNLGQKYGNTNCQSRIQSDLITSLATKESNRFNPKQKLVESLVTNKIGSHHQLPQKKTEFISTILESQPHLGKQFQTLKVCKSAQTSESNNHFKKGKLFNRSSFHLAIAYHIFFQKQFKENYELNPCQLDPVYNSKLLREEK